MHFPSLLLALFVLILSLIFLLYNHLFRNHSNQNRNFPPQVAGSLPIIGHLHLLRGPKPVARTFGSLADKSGPIFSIWVGAHRTVVISSHQAMKEFFTTNDRILASRPPSTQAKHLGYNYAAMAFAPYGTYWRDMRKLSMIHLLSLYRLKSLKHFRVSEVDKMIRDLYIECERNDEGSAKVVMSEWLEHLTLNTITRIVSGKRLFDVDNNENDKEGNVVAKTMADVMYYMGVPVPGDFIPFLGRFDFRGVVKKMEQVGKAFDSVMDKWIEEHELRRLDTTTSHKHDNDQANQDILDVMLSTVEDYPEYGHTRESIIKATAMTFIIAGSDSSAITLTWMVCNLLNNRRCLELAQEELDSKVGRERVVEDSDIDNLQYLQAIIKETLRLYPPGPVATPHEATQDCTLCGFDIPKGTRLVINLWKLHRDPSVWSDPEEFRPERFLTSHANLDVYGQNHEYLPFGSGRRICPGLNLAMQVLQLSLARLLQAFELTTPCNEPVDMTESFSLVLLKKTPLEVVLTPRLAPQLYDQ
ncbi:hypothetical protein K2173_006770 [Erythroxylum novogranatense]|uniref:Cytochrome P450 n=1 Tax=Erythroxylum novogranatense TaxID=1862640 RepID=A0AAV8SXQ1_9ROSI|nr:hypothetical protein K2173_006770 [Erythroxylum novogranatense]